MGLNQLSSDIIKAAINVHKDLGPGLLESVYNVCLAKKPLGLLINFNEVLLKDGITRIVNSPLEDGRRPEVL
jgi:hypothetical protein